MVASAKARRKLTTVYVSLTVGTGGTWSGSEAINAESDLLIANRDYALLGIEFLNECAAVSIKGPDTAGVRIAVPGSVEFADLSANYFAGLSRAFGDEQVIPVINSANKTTPCLKFWRMKTAGLLLSLSCSHCLKNKCVGFFLRLGARLHRGRLP